ILVLCFGLIMSTNLGWGLQVILLALFTLAAAIYRKPFAHLFASVNANTFTSRLVSDAAQSQALGKSAAVLPPVAYARMQRWGLRRAPLVAGTAAGVPAGSSGASPTETEDSVGDAASTDGVKVRGGGEPARMRGRGGYGRVRGNESAPPLNVNRSTGAGEGGNRPRAQTRSTDQAPSLSGNQSGSIPPRPSGGYTGTGDSGWSSVFGPVPGGSRSGSNGGGGGSSTGTGAGAGAGAGRAASAERADPSTGRGIFQGREDTPAQGNLGSRGSRWGAPRERRERRAPERRPRPAPSRGGSDRASSEGSWLTGSSKRNDNAPITPFWGESSSSPTRDRRRDVPFWLNDD